MPHAEVNGQRLYYEEHGEGEPLLCVMGLGADTLAWALQVPAWAAAHRVVIFDNRDVGRSSYADGAYEIADMAADTLALADHLGLDSFHLLGMSMGGAIAQQAALTAPERVQTLTLVVTFPGAGTYGEARARSLATIAQRLSREEQLEFMLMMTISPATYEQRPGVVAFLRERILANPHAQKPEGFARQALASGRHDARERLPELTMPTNVIAAGHDLLVPPWASEQIAELIPGARLSVIPEAPHAITLEATEEFNRLVLEFLAEHRTGAR